MTRIVAKLVRYARYVGHWPRRAARSPPEAPASAGLGTLTSRMSSVMAIAKMPSLNASTRPVSFSSSPLRVIAQRSARSGDAPRPLERRPVPLAEIRARLVRALEKVQDGLLGRGELADLLVGQEELLHLPMVVGRGRADRRVGEARRLWNRVRVKHRAVHG